jgi:PAS domain-containing protein
MTRTSRPSRAAADDEGAAAALTRAAEDLEAVTEAYDECTRALEAAEATVDALLDDPRAYVLVLDGDGRVVAMSRGMASLLGKGDAALGRPVDRVVPPTWSGLAAARTLTASEGWHSVPVAEEEGRLCLRRVTEDDRSALVVARFEEP